MRTISETLVWQRLALCFHSLITWLSGLWNAIRDFNFTVTAPLKCFRKSIIFNVLVPYLLLVSKSIILPFFFQNTVGVGDPRGGRQSIRADWPNNTPRSSGSIRNFSLSTEIKYDMLYNILYQCNFQESRIISVQCGSANRQQTAQCTTYSTCTIPVDLS